MQFKTLAILSAIVGFVAAAPTAAPEAAPEAAAPVEDLERRSCPFESHGICVQIHSTACAIACRGKGQVSCLLGCPSQAYTICEQLTC